MNYIEYVKKTPAEPKKTAITHHSDCSCTLCGNRYHNIAFKGGYVCETCVDYIRGLT